MKIYAYAWFRRIRTKAPGHWHPCDASSMARITKVLRYRKRTDPPEPGEILRGSTMNSHYDYIYVQVEVPREILEGLEEV